jgi:ABC-2 type transport system ATP-binding protein
MGLNEDPKTEPAVIVKDLYKSFKLPHEKHSGVKQLVVNLFNGNRGYEVQKVLQDVSFEIKKGEFFGIVGRNGSGKSTLLKLIAGIYVPDKGLVRVNGSLTPFIELGVGFNPELTGRENIFLNGALLGFSREEMGAMYKDIVSFAELEDFMDQKLKNYSSGMQVRLAFSIATRAKNDVLLIDEVLAVGDAAFQQKCFNYFEKLKRSKRTVIFVTHDMSTVTRFCTSAIYLENGRIIYEGSPSEIADMYVAKNINAEKPTTDDESPVLSSAHKIHGRVSEQSDNHVVLDISYESMDQNEMYAGISIIKDGISIAEITTSLQKPLQGNSKVTYSLDTDILNAGSYEVAVALFGLKNRELLAIGKNKMRFAVKGRDITKGAALKLADTWKYE